MQALYYLQHSSAHYRKATSERHRHFQLRELLLDKRMSSANYFLSKLPAGHSTTLLSKQAATALLLADALVLPSFSYKGTVPEMRELCAAFLRDKARTEVDLVGVHRTP